MKLRQVTQNLCQGVRPDLCRSTSVLSQLGQLEFFLTHDSTPPSKAIFF